MEQVEKQEMTVKGLIPLGNVGGGLGFGYASLCLAFSANAFGMTNSEGFSIAIGVVLLGFFVIYLVGGLFFLKQGNTLIGSIYIAFSVAFGLYGGAVNIAGAVCGALGIPCDFTIAAFANIIGGLYLLVLLPAMKGFSKVDFTCFLFSGIGVLAFGLAGLGLNVSIIGGLGLSVAAITAYYGSVATCFASVDKKLPRGKAVFLEAAVMLSVCG